jgi:hypothetical protein
MNWILAAAGSVTLVTGIVLVIIFRQLLSPARHHEVSVDWLNRFSISRYRAMERLFSEADFEFLKSQKGYHPSISRRLRRERCAIFRSYLSCLKRDFGRLEAAVMLCMAASRADRPDLAKAILKRRLVFTCAVASAEYRLVLYSLGLGKVDVGKLVGSLSGMRIELGQMALARQGMAA